MSERKKFQLNTEPHVAEVGEHEFHFKPEVYSDELLDTWAAMQAVLIESDDAAATSEMTTEERHAQLKARQQRSTDAIRRFLQDLQLEESATRFAEVRLPDRILIELQRWALEVYGLRPTTSSNGSSQPSSATTPGESSTSESSDAATTP